MAVVTTDLLAALTTNFRVIFETEFAAAQEAADYLKVCTIIDSETDKETYAWLGTVPKMRLWDDERVPRGLLPYDFTITNLPYEASIAVDRYAIEDDKYGMVKPRILQLAQEAARHPDELIFALLNLGHSTKAFDDVNFFANTRVIGESANIDNLLGMACSGDAAEVRAGIKAAVTAARKFQDDRTRPMNLVLDTIVCPPDMEMLIREALLPSVAGTARPEAAYVKNIIASPWLTSTVDWYMLCSSYPVKPMIFQSRKKPEFTSLDDPKSERVFMKREFLYGVDARYNVGFGDPRFAIKLDDT